MDPITTTIVLNFATNIFAAYSKDIVDNFFRKAISKKPEIEEKLKEVNNLKELEEIFNEATGVVDASVGSGEMEVIGTFIEAMKSIRFDHGNGTVIIEGTRMNAPVLVTGGTSNSQGSTTIGENTELKSNDTSIRVGKSSGIHFSGDAQIKRN